MFSYSEANSNLKVNTNESEEVNAKKVNPYSAGTDFRFLKSIPALQDYILYLIFLLYLNIFLMAVDP